MSKFVVGWDVPATHGEGVLRLVALEWPQWTCLVCSLSVSRSQRAQWVSEQGAGSEPAIDVAKWHFFGIKSLVANQLPPGDSALQAALVDACNDLDSAVLKDDDLGWVMFKPGAPGKQQRLRQLAQDETEPPYWLVKNHPPAMTYPWIESELEHVFKPGWESSWRQLGRGRFRGFHQPRSGYWLASDVFGVPTLQRTLMHTIVSTAKMQVINAQAQALWALSMTTNRQIVPTVSANHFLALLDKDPALAHRLLDYLTLDQDEELASAKRAAFIDEQRRAMTQVMLPPPLPLLDSSGLN